MDTETVQWATVHEINQPIPAQSKKSVGKRLGTQIPKSENSEYSEDWIQTRHHTWVKNKSSR